MGEAGEAGPANGVSLSFHCGSIKPTLALWFWELTSCPLASHFFFLSWGEGCVSGPPDGACENPNPTIMAELQGAPQRSWVT